jgi:hypothetical protein
MYRVKANGKARLVRETIGTVATIPNVADAREKARDSMQKAEMGIDPMEERRKRDRAADAAAENLPDTFRAVAERYLERFTTTGRTPVSGYSRAKESLDRRMGG